MGSRSFLNLEDTIIYRAGSEQAKSKAHELWKLTLIRRVLKKKLILHILQMIITAIIMCLATMIRLQLYQISTEFVFHSESTL